MIPKLLLNHKKVDLILHRFALQLIENYGNLDNCALLGLQPRGTELSKRVLQKINMLLPNHQAKYGELDITFFRDDVGVKNEIRIPKPTTVNFSTYNMRVILVDDVLYTGRSIRAALDLLMDLGRPATVELMTLIDRRYNRELPISPNYIGATVDSRSTGEKVIVEWINNDNKVWLVSKNN